MKIDDSSLSPDELDVVKTHADRLLRAAGALGRFPTPVDDIVRAAQLVVDRKLSLEAYAPGRWSQVGSSLERRARPLVSGIKKILGLLYVPSGEILLDYSQHPNRQTWIKLHETGHGVLPHQRKLYQLIEDGEYELEPEVQDLFERETNNFAGETLFQLSAYEKMAADYILSIKTPMELSKTFGSSIYASMRRYVRTHFEPLALAVYNLPEISSCGTASFKLRRAPMASPTFLKRFGAFPWPNPCDNGHPFAKLLRRRLQTNHRCKIEDLNGESYDCEAHVFNNSHQIFLLLMPKRKLGRSVVFPPRPSVPLDTTQN